MNKKAQIPMVGVIIVAAIVLIVAVILFQVVAQQVGGVTDTLITVNETVTLAAAGSGISLTGQEFITNIEVYNASDVSKIVPATNYTFSEAVVNGVKTVRLTTVGGDYASESVNISYEYGPDGYIDSSGGRTMALLIPLLMAVAIVVVAMQPTLRTKIMDMIGK